MNRHFTDSRRFIQAKKRTLRMGMGLIRLVLFFSLSFVILYPLLQKMTAAFMSVEDVYDLSVRYVPRNLTVDHFVQVWKQLDLSKAFPLTVEFVLIATLLQTFIATVVGYGLARFRFRLNRVFFVLALLGLVIPPDLLLVPLYSQFRYFDPLGLCTAFTGGPVSLINSQWPFLILAITGTGYRGGLYILLMNQFFRGMPRELEEAAYIDGAGPVYTFFRVMLPGAGTMMVTVSLFAGVWMWLDTHFIPILMPDYPVLISQLQRLLYMNNGSATALVTTRGLMINAGLLILIVPLLVLYMFTQRYFVQSVERSGLVG